MVTLRKPTPLDLTLNIERRSKTHAVLCQQETLIAEAQSKAFQLEVPPPPTVAEAHNAESTYAGFKYHAYPSCFVCGPNRAAGDGLRIFPGELGNRAYVAATWVPDETLSTTGDKVEPEFVWAALDCPGYFSLLGKVGQYMLLGQMTAIQQKPIHTGQTAIVLGWAISSEGRKHFAGTAIYSPNGDVLARAKATWIELRHNLDSVDEP